MLWANRDTRNLMDTTKTMRCRCSRVVARVLLVLVLALVTLGSVDGLKAQETLRVQGVVLDADTQQPLVAATVGALKPGSDTEVLTGGITDEEGRFSLQVPKETARLLVAYVGYESRIVGVSPGSITVELSPDYQDIEGVIVTGYGNIDRRRSTASVASVSLEKVPMASMSVDKMLQGQLAGVTVTSAGGGPNAPAKIRIRGTSSLQGTQDPLWVLDGMPLEGTDLPKLESLSSIDELHSSPIAGINPEDIETVSVLRDAAATAIYGARAANGVIVINTKSGAQGRVRVNYSGKLSVVTQPNFSRLHLLDAAQKVDLELALLRSSYGYMQSRGEVSRILQQEGLLSAYRTSGNSALTAQASNRLDSLRRINTNWARELFRTALSHDHFLSIAGGGNWADYYVSLGFYQEQGTTRGVAARRYNLTSKTTFHFFRVLDLGVSLFANQRENTSYLTNTDGYTNPAQYFRTVSPYLQLQGPQGDLLYDPNVHGFGKNIDNLRYNVLEERQNTHNDLRNRALTALFDLHWKIWRGLSLEAQAGLQYGSSKLESWATKDSYATRREQQRFMVGGKTLLPDGGFFRNTDGYSFQYTLKEMLRYAETFADIHALDVMLGNEVRHTTDESILTTAYGYDPKSLTTKHVNITESTQARYLRPYTRTYFENAFVSFFATASYTLMARYTLGASIRFDGSNLFGVDPKYRYLPLYSVSAMWDAKQERWLRDVDWLSSLRLRASWGLQGNIDKNTYPVLVGRWENEVSFFPKAPANPGALTEKSISVDNPPNDKLRWEKTATYNVGLDMAFLGYRLGLSVDYYQRNSTDLIGMRRLPLESGFPYYTVNWSSLTNRGVELNLSAVPVQVGDFRWSLQGNFSYNANKIGRLTVRSDSRRPSGEGYPVGGIFVLPYAGIDEYGYPLVADTNGEKMLISELLHLTPAATGSSRGLSPEQERSKYVYAGTDEPPYSMGFTTNFSWKGLALNIGIVGNFGHKVLVQPYYSFTAYDRGQNTQDYILHRWSEENPQGTLPRLFVRDEFAGNRKSEYDAYDELQYQSALSLYVRNAGYVRLQSLRLSYDFPQSLLGPAKMSSAQVAFEAKNLFVYGFDDKGFLDPETMKNPYAQPIPLTMTLSLRVGF